jgi:hypothetical protein
LVLAGFALALIAAPVFSAQAAKDKPQEKPQASKVFIPKEVKEPMMAGLATKTPARQDIPFTVFKSAFLPAQNAFYITMFLKAKNADLGYAPAAVPQVADIAAPAGAAKLQAKVNLFFQFHKVENGAPTQLVKEVYVPALLEADATGYDPEAEAWYTVGYPLLPGDYLATLAFTSADLKKIGIQYFEFTLPDAKSYTKALDTTPIIFLKEYKQVEAAELKPELHKGLFAYSVLRITPNIDNVFAVGDSFDIFFFIFGTLPKDGQTYDIQIDFEVVQGDKPAIKFAPGNFNSPLVSIPLPSKQTLQIKSGDQVRTESRDLPAGAYTMVLKITDKVSGLTGEKKIDFTVK